jgi:hypothetical protein
MLRTHYSYQILMTLEFMDRFLKTAEMSNFMNICPLGATLFGMDRQILQG